MRWLETFSLNIISLCIEYEYSLAIIPSPLSHSADVAKCLFTNLHFFSFKKQTSAEFFVVLFFFYVANYFMCLYARASKHGQHFDGARKRLKTLLCRSFLAGMQSHFCAAVVDINFHAMLSMHLGRDKIYMKLFRRHGRFYAHFDCEIFFVFKKSPSLYSNLRISNVCNLRVIYEKGIINFDHKQQNPRGSMHTYSLTR